MYEGLATYSFQFMDEKGSNSFSFFKCALFNPWPRSSQKRGKKSNGYGHSQVQFRV
jgi:hypothetical protein